MGFNNDLLLDCVGAVTIVTDDLLDHRLPTVEGFAPPAHGIQRDVCVNTYN